MLVFGDAIGRRKGIMGGASVMILGTIIQVVSIKGHNATAQFIIGRVVTGVGNGMNTATIPTYQAECSRTKNHGLLICIEGGIIAFGTLIAYWIDYACSFGSDDLSWRFPIAFQIVFALILLFGMIWLPESPRWLLTKDRHEDAAKVISALRGHPVDAEETRFEAHIIMDSIRASGHKGGITPFSALFTNGKTQHFRRMMLGASSQLMQQIGGCNAVIYVSICCRHAKGLTNNHSISHYFLKTRLVQRMTCPSFLEVST
jgi:MFS family permease